MNKLSELEILLSSLNQKIDVIVLAETFLHESEIKYFNLNNYNAYHNTRDTRTGGGIVIFVHRDLDFVLVNSKNSLENQSLVIYSKILNLYITGIYKPPHTCRQQFLSFLDNIITPIVEVVSLHVT